MSTFWKKISKRLKMTWKGIVSDCHFSPYLAWLRLVDELGGRLGFRQVADAAHAKKDHWVQVFLEKRLKTVLEQFSEDKVEGEYSPNAPIWVCWWTGEETAPDLVKRCLQSVREHAGNHPVVFIDRETVGQYVTIPTYMQEKVENGQMGLAHLADYIRVTLLAEYGGLWLDATIFCTAIPEGYFEMPLFTCKSETQECGYLSKMRWVTFVLGGYAGHVFYRYLKAAFEAYWSIEPMAIDYLFFDHIIELGWNSIPAIKNTLENVPINNIHRDDLAMAMCEGRPAVDWDAVIKEDTVLYKVSWRETYSPRTDQGEDSMYFRFLNSSNPKEK